MHLPMPDSLEELRVDLQNADVPCVLTQLLIPPVEVALHDLQVLS